MRRALLAGLMLLPLFVSAADGAWHASAAGPALANRGVQASSAPLAPASTVQGATSLVYWRYQLNGPAPAGLRVRLCSPERCVALEGASGSTRGLSNVAANTPLRFIFSIEGAGRLKTVLRVISSEVTVNYQG